LKSLLFKIRSIPVIIEKDINESIGMVLKPKRSMYVSLHETPWLQGWMLSGMNPEYKSV
jgi:hypothetical protein